MDDYLANKIIEDLLLGTMTTQEAWNNLREAEDTISDEKYDEITALITEQLISADMVEDTEELELEEVFKDEPELDFKWDEPYFNDISWELDPGSFDFED